MTFADKLKLLIAMKDSVERTIKLRTHLANHAPAISALVEAAQSVAEYMESFQREGLRPDEWLLAEWSAKINVALTALNKDI